MIVPTIAAAVAGFALGAYVTYRYAPTLAHTAGFLAIAVVVCGLVGAASGLAFMNVYLAIHAFVYERALDSGLTTGVVGSSSSSPDASIFANAVYLIASESGGLLALAATVFLLAAPHRDSAG